MSTVATLEQERLEIFKDLFCGNVPTRVPVNNPLGLEAMFDYAKVDGAEIYWDMTKAEAVFDKVCTDFIADSVPGGTRRYPSFYQLLGYRAFVMSSTGTMQHPEVIGMDVEDYDYLISSPYDCIVERMLPKLCAELNTTPELGMLAWGKAFKAWTDEMAGVGALMGKIRARYGFPSIPMGQSVTPFDCLADFMRGFTGVSRDLRRVPEKVGAACEAVMPLLIKRAVPPAPGEPCATMLPLHMAPFLRTKDAELYFFPTLIKMCNILNDMGINVRLSLQVKYDRFIDYLQDLPPNTILSPEQSDDWQGFKDKLGKKFTITGLYPISLLATGTKQQCIDKAKEMLDIFAPGGGYLFGFNKGMMDVIGKSAENLRAVLEYVHVNGKYSPAERSGNVAYTPKPNKIRETVAEIEKNINSKYYTPWADYKQAHPELYQGIDNVIGPKMMRYEDAMFSFIINKVC